MLGELWKCGSGISCYIYVNTIILNNFVDVIYSRSSFNSSIFSTVLCGFAVFYFLHILVEIENLKYKGQNICELFFI